MNSSGTRYILLWSKLSACRRSLLERVPDRNYASVSQYDNKKELPRITLPQRMVQKIERSIRKKASNKHQQIQHHRGPVIISCKKKSLNHRKGQTYSNFNPNHLASGNWKSPRSKSDFFTINATQGNPAMTSNESFSKLGLNGNLQHAMETMGMKKPTVIQTLAIPSILERNNVLCAADTGSGKTLTYLLPVVEHLCRYRQHYHVQPEPYQPFSIVIVPSRELADQIYNVALQLAQHENFVPHRVCGGRGTQKLLNDPDVGMVDLMVATPGVLSKLMTNRCLNMNRLNHVILDEADTLLDDSFNPLTLRLLHKLKIQSDRALTDDMASGTQIIFTGATMPRGLSDLLEDIVPVDTIEKITTPHLHRLMPHVPQKFLRISESIKPETLLKLVKGNRKQPLSTLVFCRNAKTVCFVGLFLKENGVNSSVLHADMPQRVRDGLFEQFQNGESDVLVCTDIASRGLDTVRAEHVINYDFPSFMSDYIHRAGRVGRVGSSPSSMAISFVAHKWEVDLLWKIETSARRTTDLHNVNANIKRKLQSRADEKLQEQTMKENEYHDE